MMNLENLVKYFQNILNKALFVIEKIHKSDKDSLLVKKYYEYRINPDDSQEVKENKVKDIVAYCVKEHDIVNIPLLAEFININEDEMLNIILKNSVPDATNFVIDQLKLTPSYPNSLQECGSFIHTVISYLPCVIEKILQSDQDSNLAEKNYKQYHNKFYMYRVNPDDSQEIKENKVNDVVSNCVKDHDIINTLLLAKYININEEEMLDIIIKNSDPDAINFCIDQLLTKALDFCIKNHKITGNCLID